MRLKPFVLLSALSLTAPLLPAQAAPAPAAATLPADLPTGERWRQAAAQNTQWGVG